jgi:soluble lytic murein transglycosylase-like protein/alkylhydroperoxidase/carboxymuconolactone decarboxylase family protein YurZ
MLRTKTPQNRQRWWPPALAAGLLLVAVSLAAAWTGVLPVRRPASAEATPGPNGPARAVVAADVPETDSATPSQAEARLLVQLAREREHTGNLALAAELFLRVAKAYPPVADGALDEAARVQLAAGDFAGAIDSLTRLKERFAERAAAQDVPAKMAKAYELAGDFQRAFAWHQTAAAGGDLDRRARHLVQGAACLVRLGDSRTALTHLEQALELPPNRFTVRALRLYHETRWPNNDTARAAHAAELGERWFARDEYEQAGAALEAAVQAGDAAGQPLSPLSDVFRHAAYSLFRTHHNERALALYERFVAAADDVSADDYYDLAKLYTRVGNHEGAYTAYRQLSLHPSGSHQRTALYQLAWLHIEEKDYAKAHQYFAARVKETKGRNELARWLAAWTAYRNRRSAIALTYLSPPPRGTKLQDPGRLQYWRGRVLLETGQRQAAIKTLREVNGREPAEYYGWHAAELLRQAGGSAVELRDVLLRRNDGRDAPPRLPADWWRPYDELTPRFGHAVELADVGLWRAAYAETAGIETPKKMPPAHLYELARVLYAAKRYDLARQPAVCDAIRDYLRAQDASPAKAYYPYLLPIGYREIVEHHAERFGIPAALPLAVMLHESGYRPYVVSPVYAIGLMQLLPQTGAEVAALLGETYDEDSLFDPETNIRYGCRYLRKLLDQLGGEPAYAIAAYNAGPKAVAKWLRLKPKSPEAEFVSEIPYQETNRYVRRVLTSMKKYELLLQETVALH